MRNIVKRPGLLISMFALLTMVMVLFAACGSDPTPTPVPAKAPAAAAAAPEPTATPKPAPAPKAAPKAPAKPAKPHYEGKTIRITVGFSPGGGFDTFTRLVSRHIGRHIPGNPDVIVTNRPGAGSLVTANTVYAKQDGSGLNIAMFNYAVNLQAVLGDKSALFKPGEYHWLADMSSNDPTVVYVRGDHAIKSADDWMNSSEPLIFAATGPGSGSNTDPRFLGWAGLPTKVTLGYGGSSDAFLAVFNGEADARTNTISSSRSAYSEQIEDGMIVPILAMKPNPVFGDLGKDGYGNALPTAVEIIKKMKKSNEKEILEMYEFQTAKSGHLRVFAAPPKTPPALVEQLRVAFDKAVEDPKYKEEAKRLGVFTSYATGKQVAEDVKTLADAPKWKLDLYTKFLTPQ